MKHPVPVPAPAVPRLGPPTNLRPAGPTRIAAAKPEPPRRPP